MHDLAWAAGLFEGEGTIVQRAASPWLWQLSVASTDKDVVTTFHRVIGIGKFYGPYGAVNGTNARRVHHKPYWKWQLSDKLGIIEFGNKLLPYMHARRAARLRECLKWVAKIRITRAVHVQKYPKKYPKPRLP